MLDMSRIESGKVKIEEKAVHLPDLVHDVRSIIQPNVSAKRLSLFIDTMDVENEDIITDPLRLNQILLNILSNAIKFTPTGGMISIRIAEKNGAPAGRACYEFRIKDNGIGMSEEFQKHIFEEFAREENSTVSGIQGTGLGMSITKNIVDLMGGTIAIESEPGKGSEFIVDLCFALSGQRVEPKQLPQLEGLRALVADDDTDTPNPPTDTTASITIGTGSTSGTYYAYTNAVGMILKDATGYTYNVISTGGSVANINGIEDGDYNMAIVQNDTMIKAYNKLDDFNFPVAITSFSVLGEVYSEVMQVVVRSDLKDTVKTLADVKGLRVSIGDAGSGTEANAKALLAAYGVSTDDITVQNLSVNNSADAMKDGKLDVFFFTSGAPTTAITELQTAMDIYLLGLDDAVMDEFIANNKVGDYAVYAKMAVTHDQYACIPADAPITTIGVTATYIVSNSLSEDQVYNMTKALWESKDEIAKAHAVGSGMDINNAFVTIGNVPLHPGAAKYYTEMGLNVG